MKFPGGTVHDRYLRTVNIDKTIGNTGKVKGGHQMFNGSHRSAVFGHLGGKPRIGHLVVPGCYDRAVMNKCDAELLSRQEFHGYFLPSMEADSRDLENSVYG